MPYVFISLAALLLLLVGTAAYTFLRIFYSARRPSTDEIPTPDGSIYDPYREQMRSWVRQLRAMEHLEAEVRTPDGLTLRGAFYEYEPGAPIEILFPGYHGSAERDLCGGVFRCFALGRSALLVDQRAGGRSDGHVVTFGQRESEDVHLWVDFVLKRIDPSARIILTGVSMGAATVLTAASTPLPRNVIGVLADCGYTTTRAIISKVIADMGLPARVLYPFVRLGARLFGGFDPERTSPLASMAACRLPVIFFHGDADDFVPYRMSEENFAACTAEQKRLVIVKGAGHGLCYPVNEEQYLGELRTFFEPLLEKAALV